MAVPRPQRLQNRKVDVGLPAHGLALRMAIALALTLATIQAAQAQTFQVIYNFGSNGAHPFTGVTLDASGNLYGTTPGTVYKLSHKGSGWILSVLYNFQGGTDGGYPDGRPVFGPGGLLYGSTAEGGGLGCQGYGCGTVFSLRPPPHASANIFGNWLEKILYRFGGGTDGADPVGDLIFDQAGNTYGADQVGTTGWGSVYTLTPSDGGWKQTVLYDFTGGSDGGGLSGVIFDNAGRLYGSASYGGAYGNGAIFRLTPTENKWIEETLYDFQGSSDGMNPWSGLTFDASGNLYGTTLYGGSGGGGTVFMLTPATGKWTFTLLCSLSGGGGSFGAPVFDAAGNLYDTTVGDGPYRNGTVFKLTPSNGGWTYTSLHDFTGGDDGAMPFAGLTMDAAGNLYGTTENGGTMYGQGVIFEVTPE